MIRFSLIVLLLIINIGVIHCQTIEYNEFKFEKGTESFDSNWHPISGNWIGSTMSCDSSGHSLSTGEVQCDGQNAIISYSNAYGPGYLSFSWQVAGANAIMEVYLDNNSNKTNTTCTSYSWTPASIFIPTGSHTIYWKLGFKNENNKCIFGSKANGWLCNLRVPVLKEKTAVITSEPIPVTSTPVTSTPVTSTPVTSTPVTSTPVTSTPVTSTPVTSTPVISPDTQGTTVPNISVSCCDKIIDKSDNLTVLAKNLTGKMLCLSPSDYDGKINISEANNLIITSKIVKEANIKLNGDQRRDYPNACNLILYKCNNVTIDGLRLTGGSHGIWLKNCSNCKIRNNIIDVWNGIGIFINKNSSNNIIYGNDIYSSAKYTSTKKEQPAIVIEDSDDNTFYCNQIKKQSSYSYQLTSGTNNTIFNIIYPIKDLGREYIIKPNAKGNMSFFRPYTSNEDNGRSVINNGATIEEEMGPIFKDDMGNTWTCGDSPC